MTPIRATLNPAEARAMFRAGTTSTSAGWAAGYTQANLIAVPADWAMTSYYSPNAIPGRVQSSCPFRWVVGSLVRGGRGRCRGCGPGASGGGPGRGCQWCGG